MKCVNMLFGLCHAHFDTLWMDIFRAEGLKKFSLYYKVNHRSGERIQSSC